MSVKQAEEISVQGGNNNKEQQPNKLLSQVDSKEETKPNENEDVYKTDEFRMYKFKVFPCSKRWYHDWTVCAFAHIGEKARRRDPKKYRYTGIACPDMKKFGSCVRGDECFFAHNVFEYWLHPSRYRSQLCNDGMQCKRKVCFFAHTLQELRTPSVQTEGVATFMEGGLEYPQLKDVGQQSYDPLLLQQLQASQPTDDLAQKLQSLQLNKLQGQVPLQQFRDTTRASLDSSLYESLRQQDLLNRISQQRQSLDNNAFQYGLPSYGSRQTNSTDLTDLYRKIGSNQNPSAFKAPYGQHSINNNTLRDSNDLIQQPQGTPGPGNGADLSSLLQSNQGQGMQNQQQIESTKELQQNYHNVLAQIRNSSQGEQQKQMMIYKMEENLAMAISQKMRQGSLSLQNLPRELQDIYRRHSIDTTYSLLQEAAAQQNMQLLESQRKGTSLDIPMALRALYSRNPYQAPNQNNFDIISQISSNNELLARQQQQQQQQNIQRQMSNQQQQPQFSVPDLEQLFKSKGIAQQGENEFLPKINIDQVSGLYHNEGDQSSKGDDTTRRDEAINRNGNQEDASQQSLSTDNMAFLYQDSSSYGQQPTPSSIPELDCLRQSHLAGELGDLQNSLYGNQNTNNLGWLNVGQYQNDLGQQAVNSAKDPNGAKFQQ